MGAIEANGLQVLSLRLTLPRIGIWTADVEAIGTERLEGPVRIVDGPLVWSGTAVRSGVFTGRSMARIVGGKAGLRRTVTARSYTGASVRLIATEIVKAAEEVFDTNSTAAVLSRSVPYWTRPNAEASAGLATLAYSQDAAWRVQPNGSVWLGIDTFAAQTFEHLQMTRDEINGTRLIASDRLELRPGVTFGGERVARVVHMVDGSGARTRYWVEQAGI